MVWQADNYVKDRQNLPITNLKSNLQNINTQGFPGRRILRLRLSKMCLGRTKEKHVRPPGLAKLC